LHEEDWGSRERGKSTSTIKCENFPKSTRLRELENLLKESWKKAKNNINETRIKKLKEGPSIEQRIEELMERGGKKKKVNLGREKRGFL